MKQRYINLILIVILLALVIWVDLPTNQGINLGSYKRPLSTILGLDLRGGMQVLLEVDLPETTVVTTQSMADAQKILENRSNGLGVSEVVFQVAGNRRIVGEFPGVTDTDAVVKILKQVGQLEFVDMGANPLPDNTVIKTDFGQTTSTPGTVVTPTVAATPATTPTVNTTGTPTVPTADKVYHTVMTGSDLKSVAVTTSNVGKYVVTFELKPQGKTTFADYTSKNVGNYLAIVLDKKVISAPQIQTAITEGSGEITGNYTYDTANALAVQLRYGSLPIPLKVVETRVIGPTLGQDSLNKSILAGLIGFAIVALFMLIYYRLPGGIAILSIGIYAAITLALYKFIPVTLTLPGIAGFLLSTGGALDANILIFERLKEELRSGRNVGQAVDLGWKRAWPSIRDSNIATLITSAILFWFGSAFGASIVKGFALTLAIGVVISLFCAIFVTRTFLTIALDSIQSQHEKWIGA